MESFDADYHRRSIDSLLSSGCEVYLIKNVSGTYDPKGNSYMRQWVGKGYLFGLPHTKTPNGLMVAMTSDLWAFSVKLKDLSPVKLSVEEAYMEMIGNIVKNADELQKVIDESFKKAPDGSGDFLKPKNSFDTGDSFIEKGVTTKEHGFLTYSIFRGSDVCKIIKTDTNDEFIVYLPVQWVNYAGYDEEFVKRYISFINEMMSSNITYEGKSEFKNFEKYTNIRFGKFIDSNEFYKIFIGSSENYIYNYFIFMMLRGLYHHDYNNVPGLTLKIKDKMRDKISHLRAFVLAHYSLEDCGEHGLDVKKMSQSSYRVVSVNADIKSLSNFDKKESISYSLGLADCSTSERSMVNSLLNKGDYEEAFDIASGFKIKQIIKRKKKRSKISEDEFIKWGTISLNKEPTINKATMSISELRDRLSADGYDLPNEQILDIYSVYKDTGLVRVPEGIKSYIKFDFQK